MAQEIVNLKISELHLWTENPRDPAGSNMTDMTDMTDKEIILRAINQKNDKWDLSKLIKQMGDYYDQSEILTVVKKNNKYIVYDGNRRLAIIKYSQNPSWSAEIESRLSSTDLPQNFKDMSEIPCNVCDKDTALTNIERKHINSGSWKQLERDYFEYKHREKERSLFIKFEEATGLISKNPKLNENIFKNNILTKRKLNEIGFAFNGDDELVSIYDKDTATKILNKIAYLRKKGIISSRDKRRVGGYDKYEILEPLKDIDEFKDKIGSYNTIKEQVVNFEKQEPNNKSKPRNKTKRNQAGHKILFGEKLILKAGDVNNLYSILDDIYEKFKTDKNVLPIIGISLRLLMEIAGREVFKIEKNPNANKDTVFGPFMKKIKGEKILETKEENTLSLDSNFTPSDIKNFEGYIGKYAHGNIGYDQTNILNFSHIVGKILKHYFFKKLK